jgi:hypothetical protein
VPNGEWSLKRPLGPLRVARDRWWWSQTGWSLKYPLHLAFEQGRGGGGIFILWPLWLVNELLTRHQSDSDGDCTGHGLGHGLWLTKHQARARGRPSRAHGLAWPGLWLPGQAGTSLKFVGVGFSRNKFKQFDHTITFREILTRVKALGFSFQAVRTICSFGSRSRAHLQRRICSAAT